MPIAKKKPPTEAESRDEAFVRQVCEEALACELSPGEAVKIIVNREGLLWIPLDLGFTQGVSLMLDQRLPRPATWRRFSDQ